MSDPASTPGGPTPEDAGRRRAEMEMRVIVLHRLASAEAFARWKEGAAAPDEDAARSFAERVLAEVGARADETVDAFARRFPPPRPLACRAGCAWCCYGTVWATAPEVLAVASYLRRTRTAAELASLRERLAATDAVTRPLTRGERFRARIPCPLLMDGRCTVYPVRPLRCRGETSFDAAACERALVEPDAPVSVPVWGPARWIQSSTQMGLALGIADAGLPGDFLELIAALRIALEAPDAEARWRHGEPVFDPACARLEPDEAEVRRAIEARTRPGPGAP